MKILNNFKEQKKQKLNYTVLLVYNYKP